MKNHSLPEAVRSPAGIGMEFLAFAVTLGVAVALTQDDRSTGLHVTSVWIAVAAASLPLVFGVTKGRRPILNDGAAAVVVLSAIAGSYAVGGVALMIGGFSFLIAGILHHLATAKGRRRWRVDTRRPHLVGGWLFAALGAFLGLSMSLLAPVGWLLSYVAMGLIGSALSERRRKRGRHPWLGWLYGIGGVLAMNALAWTLVIAGTSD